MPRPVDFDPFADDEMDPLTGRLVSLPAADFYTRNRLEAMGPTAEERYDPMAAFGEVIPGAGKNPGVFGDASKNPGIMGQSFGMLTPEESRADLDARWADFRSRRDAVSQLEKALGASKSPHEKRALQLQLNNARAAMPDLDQLYGMESGDLPLASKTALRSGTENAVRGLAEVGISIPEYAGMVKGYLTNGLGKDGPTVDDDALLKWSLGAKDWLRQQFPGDIARQNDFSQQLAMGLGQIAAFYGAGAAAAALKAGPALTTALVAALGGTTTGAQGFEEATAELNKAKAEAAQRGDVASVTEFDRLLKTIGYTGLGFTEAAPVASTFSRAVPNPASALGHRLIATGEGAIEEAVQEAGSQLGQNVVTQKTTDPSRGAFEGVQESAEVGGVLGALMNALMPGKFQAPQQDSAPGAGAAAPKADIEPFSPAPTGQVPGGAQPTSEIYRGELRPIDEVGAPATTALGNQQGIGSAALPAPEDSAPPALLQEVERQIRATPALAPRMAQLLTQLNENPDAQPLLQAAQQEIAATGSTSRAANALVQGLANLPPMQFGATQDRAGGVQLPAVAQQSTASATPPVEVEELQDLMFGAEPEAPGRVDPLGYYSKALEEAKALPQARGTGEQMLGILRNRGVKETEIQATGLGKWLADRPQVTKDEVVKFLTDNRVQLQEGTRGGQNPHREQIRGLEGQMNDLKARMGELERARSGTMSWGVRSPEEIELAREWANLDRQRKELDDAGRPERTKWSQYSLDPSNPTYREDVLHLPSGSLSDKLTPEQLAAREEAQKPFLPRLRDLEREQDEAAAAGRWEERDRAFQWRQRVQAEMWDAITKAAPDPKEVSDWKSGHWSEPNIIAHLRTQQLKTTDGRTALNLDELQSDEGQKIREGGVADKEKAARLWAEAAPHATERNNLQHAIDGVVSGILTDQWQSLSIEQRGQINELTGMEGPARGYAAKLLRGRADDIGQPHNSRIFAASRIGEIIGGGHGEALVDMASRLQAATSEFERLNAEAWQARSGAVGHPLVNTTDQWVETALRRLITQAVQAGVDGISITPGKVQNERYPALSTMISDVAWGPTGSDTGFLMWRRPDQEGWESQGNIRRDEIPGYIGREMTQRLLAQPLSEDPLNGFRQAHILGNLGSVEVGGEGMRATYDRMYPQKLGQLLRKFDKSIKPERVQLQNGRGEVFGKGSLPGYEQPATGFTFFPITDKVREKILTEAQPLFAIEGSNEGRQQTGNREGRTESGSLAPLKGAPKVQGATGPDPRVVEVAEQYARDNGIDLKRQAIYARVDPALATRIAEAYEAMEHNSADPATRAAYADMIAQTIAQYQALANAGYRFWFYDESNDPYDGNPWNSMRDLRDNQQLGVFATEAGFGSGATDIDVGDSPMLADTGIRWPYGSLDGPQKRVLANDLFRAVHDMFGHGMEGAGFRAQGEENAWQAHVRLYYGPAVGAVTSETRGQNSWLNFGPYGEANQTASVEDTVFADQKIGLMPSFTWEEGRAPDEMSAGDIAQTVMAGAQVAQVWEAALVEAGARPGAGTEALATMVAGHGETREDMQAALKAAGISVTDDAALDQGLLASQLLGAGKGDPEPRMALWGFHSPAARAADTSEAKSGTPQSWWNRIVKAQNVRAEELRYIGLKEWLDAKPQNEKITREEVVDFIKAHQVELTEQLREDESSLWNRQDVNDKAQEIYDKQIDEWVESQIDDYRPMASYEVYETEEDGEPTGRWSYSIQVSSDANGNDGDPVVSDEEFDTQEEAEAAAEKERDRVEEEEGSDWYNEVRRNADVSWDDAMAEAMRDLNLVASWRDNSIAPDEGTDYKELLIRWPKMKDDWSSPHMGDHEIAYVRFDERDSSDVREGSPRGDRGFPDTVMFIQEIQSDLHQRANAAERKGEGGYMPAGAMETFWEIWSSDEANADRDAQTILQARDGKLRYWRERSREGEFSALSPEERARDLNVLQQARNEAADRKSDTSDALWPKIADYAKRLNIKSAQLSVALTYNDPAGAETYYRLLVFPDAPYKGSEWWQLAFKVALQRAVKKNFDAIALPLPEQVSDAVGLSIEAAEKFYGKDLPNWINKYVKKWGAKLEPRPVSGLPGVIVSAPAPDLTVERALRHLELAEQSLLNMHQAKVSYNSQRGLPGPDMDEHDHLTLKRMGNVRADLQNMQVSGKVDPERIAKAFEAEGLQTTARKVFLVDGEGYIHESANPRFTEGEVLRAKARGAYSEPLVAQSFTPAQQPYLRLTQQMRDDIANAGQAMAAGPSDAQIQNAIRAQLVLGKAVEFNPDMPETVFVAIDAVKHAIPSGHDIGVLKRAAPWAKDPTKVVVTFELENGAERLILLPLNEFLGTRAFFARAQGDSKPGVFFARKSLPAKFLDGFRGELRHEAVHALRAGGLIPAADWSRLLRHSVTLQVLNLSVDDYLDMVGYPRKGGRYATLPLGGLYYELYRGRPDYVDAMQEESVAHMVELYHHGELEQEEIEPVFDLLRKIIDGTYAGNTSNDPIKTYPGKRVFSKPRKRNTAVAPQIMASLAESLSDRDRRILRQESATLRSDGSIVPGRITSETRRSVPGWRDAGALQRTGTTEALPVEGLTGRVTVTPVRFRPDEFISQLTYEVYPAPGEEGDQLGWATIAQHKDGTWEVNDLEVADHARRQGIASRLYRAIERDLGIRMSPSGNLMPEGYAFWKNRSPESVKWHRDFNGMYVSPRRARELLNNSSQSIASYQRFVDAGQDWARKDMEAEKKRRARLMKIIHEMPAEAKAAIPTMFAADASKQTETPEFKRWFKNSHVADVQGNPIVVYHGAMRADRIAKISRFDPKRATSGPMAFFTNDPQIASNYAQGKNDTSMTDDGHTPDYFTVSPKDLGRPRERRPYTVEQSWYALTPEQRETIRQLATRVGYQDLELGSGPFVLHPEGVDATLSLDHYNFLMRSSARGNPLQALREMWHDGGDLIGNEAELATIYRLAGYPHPISQETAPWYKGHGVIPVYLSLQNPLYTNDMGAISAVIAELDQAFKRDRTRSKQYGADDWDKNSRYTPKEWVRQLREDAAETRNSYVWTSIPDKVTDVLKRMGYDGIIDVGAKGVVVKLDDPAPDDGHTVYIPFYPTQIKSAIGNRGSFDPEDPDIRHAFAGEKAEGADLTARDQAMAMQAAGETPQAILKETGWHLGPDGRWRFEIDDSQLRIKLNRDQLLELAANGKTIMLPALVDHPALFKAYPQLAKIEVQNLNDATLGFLAGVQPAMTMREGNTEIVSAPLLQINNGDLMANSPGYMEGTRKGDTFKGTLVHEIQHAIQFIEDFASGGNYNLAYGRFVDRLLKGELTPADVSLVKKRGGGPLLNVLEANKPNVAWLAAMRTGKPAPVLTEEQQKKQKSVRDVFFGLGGMISHDLYLRLAGEAESRLADARRDLTADQRRDTYPEPDVADQDMDFPLPSKDYGNRNPGIYSVTPLRPGMQAPAANKPAPVEAYVSEGLELSDVAATAIEVVYADYSGWAKQQGLTPMPPQAFTEALRERGIRPVKIAGKMRIMVAIRGTEPDEAGTKIGQLLRRAKQLFSKGGVPKRTVTEQTGWSLNDNGEWEFKMTEVAKAAIEGKPKNNEKK